MTRTPGTSPVIHTERDTVRALPYHVTFRDLIRANKRKSALLMIGMGLLVAVLGGVMAGAVTAWGGGSAAALVPSVVLGVVAAAVVAGLASLWSFYGGSKAILRIAGARPLDKAHDPQLFNVIEELSIAAGTPMPRIYLIDDPAPNAFATGRDPEHGVVAITTGLRRQLSRDELAGVMAHEISHIRHYDIRFAMLMATMVGLIVFASDAFWRIMWVGRWHGTRIRSARGGGTGNGAAIVMVMVMAIALILALITPTLAMLIRLAVSRQREYLADAGAVELTRYPQGLIGALQKLGASKQPLKAANRATAHLYIVNPLRNALKGKGHQLSSAFRTHPPLGERIARLRALIEQPMPGLLFILIPVVLAAIAAGVYFGWQAQKKRREALAAVAARLGWHFDFRRDRDHDDEYAHFEIFRRGHGRAAYNTLTGEAEIGGRRCPAKMGDFMYKVTTSTGKSTTTRTYRFSYLILHLDFGGVPDLLIRREGVLDKVAGAFGFDDIDFESAEFSRRFCVKSPDKRFAYDVLHPRMMEFLLAGNPPAIDIEHGRCCLSDGRRRWEPQHFETNLAWIDRFFDHWPPHVMASLEGRS